MQPLGLFNTLEFDGAIARLALTHPQIRVRWPPRLRYEKVFSGIRGNSIQPGIKLGLAPKGIDGSVSFDECFLRHVHDFVLIPDKSRHQC